jgi:serine/threonine-protein kinase RsbW
MALQQAALSAITRLDGDLGQAMTRPGALPGFPASPSRVFLGAPDQIRAVRSYVRTGFAGHAAAHDAVLVVSELAAKAVRHSASGLPGGIFLVHLARLGPADVAIIVTDQGGTDHAPVPHDFADLAPFGRFLEETWTTASSLRSAVLADI